MNSARMHATIQIAPPVDHSACDRARQCDHIERLLDAGDKEVSLGRYPEATLSYYSVFQPELCGAREFGLRRVASMDLFEEAASRLRVVASRYAEELLERRCLLAGESPDGPIGVPRGALNLYLISNQHEVFTEHALQYAFAERRTRNINRFLASSVRARLLHLQDVSQCAPLLREEQETIAGLAGFEQKMHARLVERIDPE